LADATWTHCTDLPSNWEDLASDELPALLTVWREQSAHLRDSKALQAFNERLAREWAIETGIIERLYTLDEGVSRLLVERGLHASLIPHGTTDKDPEYVVALIKDQHETVAWLFDFVQQRRNLSTSFVKELHQLLTRHQEATITEDQFGNRLKVELERGVWRKLPVSVERLDGTRYACCPAEQITSEMDTLLARTEEHKSDGVPAEVAAAWLHHRFTQIHPFQDGNGRVARALATLVFLREGFFSPVVRRDDREKYLQSLYYADAGDLGPLVKLFADLQQRAFVEALSVSREVLHENAGLKEIIDAAADRLKERAAERAKRMSEVFKFADLLHEAARKRLSETAKQVKSQLQAVDRKCDSWADFAQNDSKRDDYYHYQVVEAAKKYRYFANTQTYRAWVLIAIKATGQTDILLSFHCLGSQFSGVMVCSAMTYRRERSGEEKETAISDVDILSDSPFQFNYNDHKEVLTTRFGKWVDQVLAVGLDRWRRSL